MHTAAQMGSRKVTAYTFPWHLKRSPAGSEGRAGAAGRFEGCLRSVDGLLWRMGERRSIQRDTLEPKTFGGDPKS